MTAGIVRRKVVGVFDSGVGGASVVRAIKKRRNDIDVEYVTDTKHIPYGTKSVAELHDLVRPILQKLAQEVDIIVIACNTVSTTLATSLRIELPVPIIAMEPMVKPAAVATKSKTIAVCATPTTLKSKRYTWLKKTYAPDITVLEPDCSEWSAMIESRQIDREAIRSQIDVVCRKEADVIVLGCTHYHWIEKLIFDAVAGRAQVIQPEQPTIDQLERVLAQLD